MGWTTLRAQVVSTIYTALNTHLLGHLPPLSLSIHHFPRSKETKRKNQHPLCDFAFVNHLSLPLSLSPRCYAVLSSFFWREPISCGVVLQFVVSWTVDRDGIVSISCGVKRRQLCVMWKHVTTHGGDGGGGCWWSKYEIGFFSFDTCQLFPKEESFLDYVHNMDNGLFSVWSSLCRVFM